MKKALVTILILTLTLLSVCAYAQPYADMSEVVIRNTYTVTNPGTHSPEETFSFTIESASVTDAAQGVTVQNMPVPTVGSVRYAYGEAGSNEMTKEIKIELPEYPSVGVYTYSIRSVKGTNAGVGYYNDTIRLVVTVIEQNGQIRVAAVHTETSSLPLGSGKSDTITTDYSAGKVAVSKKVTGNLGDKSRYFDIHVKLIGESGKTYAESYPVSGGSYADNPKTISLGEETTFRLKDDETVTIANLPYGVTYTVTETDYSEDGYETSIAPSDENCLVNSASDTVTVTNHKDGAVDTGILTDSLPYLLMLGAALVSLTALLLRRRANNG